MHAPECDLLESVVFLDANKYWQTVHSALSNKHFKIKDGDRFTFRIFAEKCVLLCTSALHPLVG